MTSIKCFFNFGVTLILNVSKENLAHETECKDFFHRNIYSYCFLSDNFVLINKITFYLFPNRNMCRHFFQLFYSINYY